MAGFTASNRPKPFSRPSIDLGGEKREWRTVPWDDIYPGDLVADEGLVESREDIGDVMYHKTARSQKATPKGSKDFDVMAFVKVSG